jgi:WD40 repeat protein
MVLAGAARDGQVEVWDLKDGKLLTGRSVAGSNIRGLVISSAGQAVAWNDKSGIAVLDVATRRETLVPSGGDHHIVSSHGAHVLVQRMIRRAHPFVTEIWDATADPPRRTHLLEGFGPENCAAITSDEKSLAIGSWNNEIRIYDALNWEQVNTLKGHTGEVLCLAFSSDSNLLVSGGADNTVRVWKPTTGQIRVTLNGHRGSVTSVAFSPNHDSIASSSEDGTVKIWITASPDEVEENLEARLDAAEYFLFRGQFDRASEFVEHVVQQSPENDEARTFRARLNVAARRWSNAAANFREFAERNPDDASLWLRTAPLYVQAGDLDGYHRLCRQTLTQFSSTDQAMEASKVAKMCLFVAPEASALQEAVALADKAVSLPDRPDWGLPFVTFVRGLADYRTGDYQAAQKRSRATLTMSPKDYLGVHANLLLAMSCHQLGADADALRALQDAEVVLVTQPTWWALSVSPDLHDWLICQTLFREAQELIRGSAVQ